MRGNALPHPANWISESVGKGYHGFDFKEKNVTFLLGHTILKFLQNLDLFDRILVFETTPRLTRIEVLRICTYEVLSKLNLMIGYFIKINGCAKSHGNLSSTWSFPYP